MKNIQKLIEENSKEVDGEKKVDWKSVEDSINKETNDIVAKQTSKAQEDLLKQLGFEDSDKLKEHLSKVDELSEETKKKDEKINELSSAKTETERKMKLIGMGITDEDTLDYVMYNVNKRANDDTPWEKALESYKQDKPSYFESQQENKPITTGTKNEGNNSGEKLGFEKILGEKHPDVFGDKN